MLTSLLVFAIAGVVAFLITPPVRRVAERFDVIDKPDRRRKHHRRLVPLWGGLAIFSALLVSLWIVLQYTSFGQVLVTYREGYFGTRLPFLFFAVFLITCVGLLDDRLPLPPKVKLLAQLSAVGLVVLAGFRIETLQLPWVGYWWHLWPGIGIFLACVWLIFVINAFNFIDGLDGLASSQALISGCALTLGALLLASQSQDMVTRYQCFLAALVSAAAAGAALGFWRFNHFPAKIFLGDAGSNVLGFLLGFAALLLVGRALSFEVWIFVCLVLGWPIFDTAQVILRRWRRGEPISKADNRHGHHFLLQRGFTNSAAVAFIDMIVIVLCVIGLVILWL
ncbi:undecaprenyl/decaprenyl-phosphate alpha-N-acetylglucosaminyl 1-phosphate transferase [bacterium]|nr:undecaprenyl/decaprenyl-phosphate alpha-N-acetylglucosaminyl 1-phosphate transferase [bacterium]